MFFVLLNYGKLLRDELYVMLMLQRSEALAGGSSSTSDCDDPMVKVACSMDTDACPAACKTESKDDEPTVVKAGDLEVSASAGSSKILAKGTSDMDTLTFKSSEEVEITKVVLERYGYSTNDDVVNVWLENEDGTIIAEPRSLDSKGQAKLSIKKDYRIIDGTYNATIVLSANGSAGKTIGFKVVDVDSTAKNLNIDNYKPYQYDMMEYSGANVTVTARGTTKDYNWEAGELYEIAKFKVKAPTDSSILVKGFTLSNVSTTNNVDIRKYLDNAEVTVDGDKVSASYEVNKDDQLVISFKKDVEVAAKANVEVVVKASLSEDFDDYGKVINLKIAQAPDFNAIDSKTESRVSIPAGTLPTAWPQYNFKGGKVKLTNTRLGNVDAAQNSDDVIVAEGNITVPEDIKGTLVVEVNASNAGDGTAHAIQAMRVVIAGDEYEGKLTYTWNAGTISWYDVAQWTFTNVEVVDSGKIQFKVDTRDVDWYANQKVSFSFKTGFNTFNYVEAKTKVELAGSISFSNLTIQAARASLTNSATKAVEFRNNESNRKVVFEGEYTAKKWAIKLNEFILSGSKTAAAVTGVNTGTITFYLSIDGDEVADAQISDTTNTGGSTFSSYEIDAGKSVKVVLEAEIDAKSGTGSLGTYKLTLKGEDENGNEAGEASRATVELKVVEKGSITVNSSSSEKKTVLKKATNVTLAEFIVKPSNGASEVDLEEIIFQLSWTNAPSSDDITVSIDGTVEDSTVANVPKDTNIVYQPTVTLGSEGVRVKVELNVEVTGVVELTGLVINGKKQSANFSKRFEDVIVRIVKQEDVGSVTKFTVEVDGDDDITVSDLLIGTGAGAVANIPAINWEFNDGDTFEVAGNDKAAQMIESIRYTTSDSTNPTVDILKSQYNDFFKIGDTYARILKA